MSLMNLNASNTLSDKHSTIMPSKEFVLPKAVALPLTENPKLAQTGAWEIPVGTLSVAFALVAMGYLAGSKIGDQKAVGEAFAKLKNDLGDRGTAHLDQLKNTVDQLKRDAIATGLKGEAVSKYVWEKLKIKFPSLILSRQRKMPVPVTDPKKQDKDRLPQCELDVSINYGLKPKTGPKQFFEVASSVHARQNGSPFPPVNTDILMAVGATQSHGLDQNLFTDFLKMKGALVSLRFRTEKESLFSQDRPIVTEVHGDCEFAGMSQPVEAELTSLKINGVAVGKQEFNRLMPHTFTKTYEIPVPRSGRKR